MLWYISIVLIWIFIQFGNISKLFTRWLFIGPMQLMSRVGMELSRPQLMFKTAAFAFRGSSPSCCPNITGNSTPPLRSDIVGWNGCSKANVTRMFILTLQKKSLEGKTFLWTFFEKSACDLGKLNCVTTRTHLI